MTTATKSMGVFMKGKAKQAVIEEVVVSRRYEDEEGNPIPFRLKAVDTKRIEDLQDECTVPQFKKGKKVGEEVDWKRFACRLAVETTIYPDFRDQELLSSYGLVDPCDLVKEILNVGGEYAELIQAVQRVNGFDTDFEELVDDAKKLIRSGDYHALISHRVWQKHHVAPQELWHMDDYHRAFIYASEFLEMDAERKSARAQGRK